MASSWANLREKWETAMDQLDQKLHQKGQVADQLEKLEKKLSIPRLKIVQVAFFVVFITISLLLGTELISNCIGFLYPAYASIKAIETARKDDDTRWLTYWVVYGFFVFTESITDIFLSWFPFYWVSKCIFLIWCMFPTPSNGSDFIYNFIIRPFFLKHEKKIDSAVNEAASAAKHYIGKVSNAVDENNIYPKSLSTTYQDKQDSSNTSHYESQESEDREKFPPFTFKLDELRTKYGDGKSLMASERSLSATRSRLFPERSPERTNGNQSSVDGRSSPLRERSISEMEGNRAEPVSLNPPARSTARQTSRSRPNYRVGDSYQRTGKH